jgi:hypothetical protein
VNGVTGRTWALVRLGVLALLWGSTFLWIKLALDAGSRRDAISGSTSRVGK